MADCWELLEPGGTLVFDDAYYAHDTRQRGPGVEAGLREVWDGFYFPHQDECQGYEAPDADPPFCWLRKGPPTLTIEFEEGPDG